MEKQGSTQPKYIVDKPKTNFKLLGYILLICIFSALGGAITSWYIISNVGAITDVSKCRNDSNLYPIGNVENPVVGVVKNNIDSVVSIGIGNKKEGTEELVAKRFSGTGMIYSKDGYVITNYHVIEEADKNNTLGVYVIQQETTYNAVIVGKDSYTDIAVLKIEGAQFRPVAFADSSTTQVGEMVVAIGNPTKENLAGTVTVGYISALNRKVTIGGNLHILMQTDRAINTGNSGGPLVNALGKVVGMNIVETTSIDIEGISFAIPSNTVIEIVDKLIQDKEIKRPYIGIYGTDITKDLAIENNTLSGILVVQIVEDTPAALAGVMAGDYITHIQGVEVATMEALNNIKNQYNVGDTITLKILRPKDLNATTTDYEEKELKLILIKDTGER